MEMLLESGAVNSKDTIKAESLLAIMKSLYLNSHGTSSAVDRLRPARRSSICVSDYRSNGESVGLFSTVHLARSPWGEHYVSGEASAAARRSRPVCCSANSS